MHKKISRRTVLRGVAGGSAVAVGLPLLDYFLNDNGTALAQGAPIPVRFGTWFWGNGMNPDRWVPPTDGPDYELSIELQAIADVKQHVSVLSGFDVRLDGRPNTPHHAGIFSNLTGTTPFTEYDVPAPTFDTLISAEISALNRFRSLELSATGVPSQTYSRQNESIVNASQVSPIAVYNRIFGPEFHDPNEGEFTPDPRLVLRQSVLSAIEEDRTRLENILGTHDRQRLDQYFTSLRQLENQLELLLSGPPDLAACARPPAPGEESVGTELPQANSTHALMTDLLTFALACDQTRVFNMIFSWGLSALRIPGTSTDQHQLTHDERIDLELGYQPQATQFFLAAMDAWGHFVRTLANFEEGDGSLLDNCLVFAHSESAFAKIHEITGLPMMIAGKAGGRIQSGLHVRGNASPTTRAGLTIQQVMGLPVDTWGTSSMETNQTISEILV